MSFSSSARITQITLTEKASVSRLALVDLPPLQRSMYDQMKAGERRVVINRGTLPIETRSRAVRGLPTNRLAVRASAEPLNSSYGGRFQRKR